MSRCLSYLVIAVAAMTLASPLAAAQLNPTPPFTLAAEDEGQTVFAGETAGYTIRVGNEAVIKRTATMRVTSLLPVNWTYQFTPDPVEVNA